MVNAGLAPITVVDDYLAEFWKQVFTNLTVHGDVAAAIRRQPRGRVSQGQSPSFAKRSTGGSGSTERATPSETWSNAGISKASSTRRTPRPTPSARSSTAVIELFKKYGAQYDVDYLLMAAQGYQESTLDQNVKSPVGAIGVMQVMPATGKRTERRRHHARSSRTSTPA